MTKGYEANKKWRHLHPETRHRGKNRYYQKTAFAPNSRQMWTGDEDKLVLEFDGTDTQLSEKIGRSVGAIQHRRHRLTKEES